MQFSRFPLFGPVLALCLVAGHVSASDLRIIKPAAGDVWYGDTVNMLTWTGTSPSKFNVMLVNDDGTSLTASEHVETSAGQLIISLGSAELHASEGYRLELYDVSNSSNIYASSGRFGIQQVASPSTIIAEEEAQDSSASSTSTAMAQETTASALAASSGDSKTSGATSLTASSMLTGGAAIAAVILAVL